MSERLDTVITFDEACVIFRDHVLPMVTERYEADGIKDDPARCETWNNWVDGLNKDRLISDWQAMNWSHPDYL